MRRRSTALVLCLLVAVMQPCSSAPAQPIPADAASGGPAEITTASREAVARGLTYLASTQAADGHFASSPYGRNVAVASLACLAFMADGNLPDRGPYAQTVRRGVDFVIDSATETGLIAAETSHGPMYGHGFATLMLAEVYGHSDDPRLHDVLVKAVRLIVRTQNHEGGWRYQPTPYDADISVTICQVMALRAARNAGLAVPAQTIDRAIVYVRNCQNASDGGFRYMLRAGASAFPRSAAGVASLYYAGVYDDPALRQGLAYLQQFQGGDPNEPGGHFFYGHYYAAQAMFLAGGTWWTGWFGPVRDSLINAQGADGSWSSTHGSSYATAMALLVLQVPNRYLPIFQR